MQGEVERYKRFIIRRYNYSSGNAQYFKATWYAHSRGARLLAEILSGHEMRAHLAWDSTGIVPKRNTTTATCVEASVWDNNRGMEGVDEEVALLLLRDGIDKWWRKYDRLQPMIRRFLSGRPTPQIGRFLQGVPE